MKYRPKHLVEYALLRGIGGFLRVLPLRAALAVGWAVAALGHVVARGKVREARRRIRSLLGPAAAEAEVRQVAWIAWRNLMFNGVEALRAEGMTVERLRTISSVEGKEAVDALRASGTGFIFATAHLGNWELAGLAASLLGIPLIFLARRQKNPLVNAYLDRLRQRIGRGIESRSKDVVRIPEALRQGAVLGMLVDVRARAGGLRVPFLGGIAPIPAGMARFARDAGVPVVPVVLVREGWTHHRWRVHPPVRPDPAAGEAADLQRITAEVLAIFDQAVRRNPAQFFWFNKRWVLEEA